MEPLSIVLSFFVGIGLISLNSETSFKMPSETVVKRWEHTSMPPQELSKIITDEHCQENEKTFLACAAALENMGRYLQVHFVPTGRTRVLAGKEISQKNILKQWSDYYITHHNEAIKISFKKIFENKIIEKTDKKIHSMLTVAGINGYYSITKDPHSYLDPIKLVPIVRHPFTPKNPGDLVPEFEEDEETDYDDVVDIMINNNKEEPSLLTIDKFNDNVCDQTKEALKEVISKEVTNLIIDIKDNPGGLVDQVVCVAGLFLGKQKIVQLRYFGNKFPKEVMFSKEDKMYAGKLTIFINESSASASEILAGALQFYKRAELVGKRSFGKGTFQQPTPSIYNKYNLRYMQTNGFFYLPDGRSPQLIGLSPDKDDQSLETALREDVYYLYPLKAEDFD